MALFIIGVGVLSIVTVYLQRERAVSITAQQALAHRLANEMAQRIESQSHTDVRFENAIGVRCAAAPGTSTPPAQAQAIREVACWQERVAAELPNGTGSIALDDFAVPPSYAITVSWSLPRGGLASYTVRATVKPSTPAMAASTP